MRRPWFWVLVLFAAITGFVLGRATGTAPIPGLNEIHKEFPLFPAPPKPDVPVPVNAAPAQESDVVVEVPVDGAVVSDGFVDVEGRAKTAGGPLRVQIKDASGAVIAESDMDLTATDGVAYGRFGQTITFKDKPPAGDGTVEITRAITGGAPVVRHVTFSAGTPAQAGLTVKAFFRKDAGEDCGAVDAVTRPFDGKTAVYRAALAELLKGPSADEKTQGYSTAIPAGVVLKSVAADADGLVTADFTQTLTRGVTASCRISSVRAQIEQTLRQFPEVHGVVISVNGKTDGVLQP